MMFKDGAEVPPHPHTYNALCGERWECSELNIINSTVAKQFVNGS